MEKKNKILLVDTPGGLVSNTLLPNNIHETHDVIIVGDNGPEMADVKLSGTSLSDVMSRVNQLNMNELNFLDTIYSPFDKKRNTNMTPPKKKRKKK